MHFMTGPNKPVEYYLSTGFWRRLEGGLDLGPAGTPGALQLCGDPQMMEGGPAGPNGVPPAPPGGLGKPPGKQV